MNFVDWIPALSTAGTFGILIWLLRKCIAAYMVQRVRYEFDKKLEAIRAEHRESEERLRADLRRKQAEIDALRSGALTALATRQAELDKRRIEAADQLWSAVVKLAPAKTVSAIMSAINYDVAVHSAEHETKLRTFFERFGSQNSWTKLGPCEADMARPFLPQIVWALFTAYRAIIGVAVVRLGTLKAEISGGDWVDETAFRDLVQAALPHRAEFLDRFDIGACHFLLDELETRMLQELGGMLEGAETNKQNVEQAATIMRHAESLLASTSSPASGPDVADESR
ncbi:MAG: hypothetical protein ACP5HU_01535 [Phycisphaerae bacterium]